MSLQTIAAHDAKEFARAQMFYGEGAGNRRKLIQAVVQTHTEKHPGYASAFNKALSRQDMAEHAIKARHERARKDLQALITGRAQQAQVTLMAVAVGTYLAHQTGVDAMLVKKSNALIKRVHERVVERREHE